MTLSRKPIESTRTLPLPSRPVEGFVNDQQALSEAVVGELRIYNTHLNYLGEDQRLDQAQRILSLIAEAPERGGPVTSRWSSHSARRTGWSARCRGRNSFPARRDTARARQRYVAIDQGHPGKLGPVPIFTRTRARARRS